MRWHPLIVLMFVVGCSDPGSSDPWELAHDGGGDVAVADTAAERDGDLQPDGGEESDDAGVDARTDAAADCDGEPFDCVGACPDEDLAPAECAAGTWVCTDERRPRDECPDEPECEQTTTSDLDGVSIEFTTERCAWTLDELESGVTISWEVTVTDDAPDKIVPSAQDAGRCGRPGDSGLITFYLIGGDGEDRYCRCDEGLCAPMDGASDLTVGTFPDEFEWTGRNWSGPSDTGNPMGEPFDVGPATVRVSAVGEREDGMSFEVAAELPIEVLP